VIDILVLALSLVSFEALASRLSAETILAKTVHVCTTAPPCTPCSKRYPAALIRIVDGDTYALRIYFDFGAVVEVHVRDGTFDAPERNAPGGPAASEYARKLFDLGWASDNIAYNVAVMPPTDRSFARWVATVCIGHKPIGELMRAAGHVKK
jgi:endonuclease YncB( thermonuclease family)